MEALDSPAASGQSMLPDFPWEAGHGFRGSSDLKMLVNHDIAADAPQHRGFEAVQYKAVMLIRSDDAVGPTKNVFANKKPRKAQITSLS
jgi:hypothetical protein